MRKLDIAPSAPKLWAYGVFGGGRGKSKEAARLELEAGELASKIKKALKPNPKKPGLVQDNIGNLALTCAIAADKAIKLGDADLARRLTAMLDGLVSSPLMLPPPDERPDGALTEVEVESRNTAWTKAMSRRSALLQKKEAQVMKALELAEEGSEAEQDLQDQLAKSHGQRLTVNVRPRDPFRAALTQDLVASAMSGLEESLRGVAADGFEDALITKLGSKLTNMIDDLVREAIVLYLQDQGAYANPRTGATGKSYSVAMNDLLKDPSKLHDLLPGLDQMIQLEVKQFTDNMTELFGQVDNDQKTLEDDMFGGKKVKGLKDVTVTNSDPHHGGRRVTLLTFASDSGDLKVVNKPRDVRVDAKFVGETGESGMGASMSERATELMRRNEAKRLQSAKHRNDLLELLKTSLEADFPDGLPSDKELLESIDTLSADDLMKLSKRDLPLLTEMVEELKEYIADPPHIDKEIMKQAERNVPALL